MEHSVVVTHRRRRGPRHRAGTPGLTPYRCLTIEPGRPRRAKARHHRRRHLPGSQVVLVCAAAATLILLVLGGYRAAEGAAIVLGMF